MKLPDKILRLLSTVKVNPREIFGRFEKLLILISFLFSLEFFSFHLIYLKKVIPGVSLVVGGGEVDLSGKTYSQALDFTGEKYLEYERAPLIIKVGELERKVYLNDLGIYLNATQSARKAYLTGRTRNIIEDLKTEYKTFLFGFSISPSYSIDENKFDPFVTDLIVELSTRDARLTLSGGRLKVVPEWEGLNLTRDSFTKALEETLSEMGRSVTVETERKTPAVTAAQLESLRSALQNIYSSKPSLTYGNKSWSIDDESFLRFYDYKNSKEDSLKISIQGLGDFVESLSREINIDPRAISFEVQDGTVTSFEAGRDGLIVDEPELKGVLSQALTSFPSSLRKIAIPVERVGPAVSPNEYGIKELIGEGISYFAGSIPGRRNNIKLASSKLNGLLIPPEKVFSFNEAVGEISAATGYDYAYIISEGRTILGAGGGVCQVSTTVFRAALNAGLPILKRTAHAYRVGYYEQGGFLPGLDATVFSPSVDLVFKNDTGSYLLIQSVFENEKDTLIFRIYGTKDGRTVEIEGPVITSSSGAPAPLYQEDPTLPKGTVRQVDFAAGGASVYFKRLVDRDGQRLAEDTFYSRYQPWRAVYLVGTKE